MEFLGVGPLEFGFFLLIALILFGPNDMAKAGRTIGRFLRRVVTSEEWRAFNEGLRELRQLPTNLIREAGLDERDLQIMSQPFEQIRSLPAEVSREFNAGLKPPAIPPAERNSAAGYGSWSGQAPHPASGVQAAPPPESPSPETPSPAPPEPESDPEAPAAGDSSP